jgi:hypothetical protein
MLRDEAVIPPSLRGWNWKAKKICSGIYGELSRPRIFGIWSGTGSGGALVLGNIIGVTLGNTLLARSRGQNVKPLTKSIAAMLKLVQKGRALEWTLSAFFEKCLVSAETANFLHDTLLQLIVF